MFASDIRDSSTSVTTCSRKSRSEICWSASLLLFITSLLATSAFSMQVAITVDDLPWNGDLPPGMTRVQVAEKMLAVFKKHHIKGVYGLINGSKLTENTDGSIILQNWVKAGQLLGNHTYSHIDLAKTNSSDYIADIAKNESILNKLMVNDYHYFRYPYLGRQYTRKARCGACLSVQAIL